MRKEKVDVICDKKNANGGTMYALNIKIAYYIKRKSNKTLYLNLKSLSAIAYLIAECKIFGVENVKILPV